MENPNDPHDSQPVYTSGTPLTDAEKAVILLHGRGASAEDILSLAGELNLPGVAYLAPQAADYTWYPYRFLEPAARNQPWLDSALRKVDELVSLLQSGLPIERIFLLGFSQGGCLALEYAARHPQRYGGVIGLSAGLIGADGELVGADNGLEPKTGNLEGAPVFLGCSDVDPHIPLERVQISAEIFEKLGGAVTTRIYPGLDHTVNEDELEQIRKMLSS